MIRHLLLALAVFFTLITSVFAHPHAFVECKFSFVMDDRGLVGFKQQWTLDEMTTVSVLDVIDKNRDGSLSAEEKIAVRDMSVNIRVLQSKAEAGRKAESTVSGRIAINQAPSRGTFALETLITSVS